MAKLTKRQRSVADAVRAGATLPAGMSQDEFDRVLDCPQVRDWIRRDRERQIFVAGQEAISLLNGVLKGPQPGVKVRNFTSAEQKAIEFTIKLNGLTGKNSIEDKGSSGVEEFINPVAVPN